MSHNPNPENQQASSERLSQALRAQRLAQQSTEEVLRILVTPIVNRQQQTEQLLSALHSSVSELSQQFRDLSNLFKDVQLQSQDQVNKTVTAISETLSSQVVELEKRLATSAQLHVDTVEAHSAGNTAVSESLRSFIEALQSSQGPSHLGFDIQEPYAENTLGYTVKNLFKLLEAANSSFINLGPTAELYVAAKTIIVTQTLNVIRCPKSVTSVDLEMIRGGSKNDLAILTSVGEVNLKVSGNMRLKSECTLVSGRSIVLKKTEDGWDELWRSH